MRFTVTLPLLCTIALLAACSKKDDTPPPLTGPVTQQEINNWILDSMRVFYLWNRQLPEKPDHSLETQVFFSSIRNAEDKYSIVYNPDDASAGGTDLLYKYGLDFSIISWPQAAGSVMGVVQIVIPGSGAEQAGFKRGDYFTRINGTLLTSANAVQLSEEMKKAGSSRLTKASINGGTITEDTTITLQGGSVNENPVYLSTVFDAGTKKAGYIFYNAFVDRYDRNVLAAFNDFKRAGISDLVMDIRYNSGGSLAAAAMITVITAPGTTASGPYVRYTGNDNQGTRMLDFSTTLAYPESGGPIRFADLVPSQLMLPRVYILTGRRTISAAELLINNLKPYTQVIQIGAVTAGKDKGAVIIEDTRTPRRIPWVIVPLTYRLANANGEGNYDKGITPQYLVDEMGSLPLLPIGDPKDPLIAKALALIGGNGRAGTESRQQVTRVYEAGSNKMLIIPNVKR